MPPAPRVVIVVKVPKARLALTTLMHVKVTHIKPEIYCIKMHNTSKILVDFSNVITPCALHFTCVKYCNELQFGKTF